MKRIATFLMLALLGAAPLGAVPLQLTFQGTLKQQGVPVNTPQNLSFSFVDGTGASIPGSVPINMANVEVSNGLFAVQLPIDPSINWQAYTPYIQVSVNGQNLTPNQPLTSNLYSIVAQTVVNGAIGTVQLANGAVTSAQIAANAVGTTQLAAGAVTTVTIATAAVMDFNIAPGAISEQQLGPGAVTTVNLATAAVQGFNIAPGAVSEQQLANGAVTSAQIANNTIGSNQLAAGAVISTTVANGAITNAQLGEGSVTLDKLDPSVQIVTIPSGLIALFSNGCPTGWSLFTALQGKFPVGGDGSSNFTIPTTGLGTAGGSLTHTHTTPAHQHPMASGAVYGNAGCGAGPVGIVAGGDGTMLSVPNGSNCAYTSLLAETTLSGGGVTGSASSLPPYQTVVFCMKN